MKERSLIDIYYNPTDYKVCNSCSRVNWYENDHCVSVDCTNSSFEDSEDSVIESFEKKY